jgi:hypothetical protein
VIPHFERYNLAEYLKLGTLAVCTTDEWGDPTQYCDEPDDGLPTCHYVAQHKVILTVMFNRVPIMRQTLNDGALVMPDSRAEAWTRDNWITAHNYKGRFEALGTIDPPSPAEAEQQAALLATTTRHLENVLAGYQKELYGRVLNEFDQGVLKPAVTEAAGAKALIDAFATLGLPRAVGNDEFLHAMLFGSQRLIDNALIAETYILSATQPISTVNLLVNPRSLIGQMAGARTDAFSELVNQYLAAITAKTHVEAPDYIANTRRTFNLTMRIAQIEVPQPTDEAIAGLQASSDGPTPLGNATRFAASVTAGTNVSYAWDFGNGQVGVGANPTHIYDEPGVYVVRVVASNSANQLQAEVQVAVVPDGTGIYLPLIER